MTIGIGAYGPEAGAAAIAALGAAEAVGRGAIGGFAIIAGMSGDGTLSWTETQRGGVRAAMDAAERNGTADLLLAARVAAVISSGPDRPEPLRQFLVGAAGVGLVTGHRLPHLRGHDGRPVNLAVLEEMKAGAAPDAAVAGVLAKNPEIDAGLIAVSRDSVAACDSRRVRRRGDSRMALRNRGVVWGVATLHNSIYPIEGLAAIVLGTAAERLRELASPRETLILRPGVPVQAGPADRVHIDVSSGIIAVESANPHLIGYPHFTSGVVYCGSEVVRDGGVVGHTVSECRARITNGRVTEIECGPGLIAWIRRDDEGPTEAAHFWHDRIREHEGADEAPQAR